jgi:hypothetical protein
MKPADKSVVGLCAYTAQALGAGPVFAAIPHATTTFNKPKT